MIVTLVEMWRDSRRQGDNMLLAAALPSLLLAVNVAGQRSLLDAARTLIDKVWCLGFQGGVGYQGMSYSRAAGATRHRAHADRQGALLDAIHNIQNRVLQVPSPKADESCRQGVHMWSFEGHLMVCVYEGTARLLHRADSHHGMDSSC